MFFAVIICIVNFVLFLTFFKNPVCLFIIISLNAFDVALMFVFTLFYKK